MGISDNQGRMPYALLQALENIFQHAEDWVWAVDDQYRLIFANKAYHDVMHFLLGHSFEVGEVILSDESKGHENMVWKGYFDQVLRDGRMLKIDTTSDVVPGGVFMEFHFSPLYIEEWETKGVLVIGRNITEKRRLQNELNDALNLLNETEHLTHSGSWDYDLNTQQMKWSPELFRLHGWPPGNTLLLGLPDLQEIIKGYDAATREALTAFFNGPLIHHQTFSITGTYTSPAGLKRWHTIQGKARICDPDENRVVGSIQDITESQMYRFRLKAQEERYRKIIDKAAEMVFLSDLDGNFCDVNEAVERNLGYTREELLQMKVPDIDPDVLARQDKELKWDRLEEGREVRFEVVHKRKDGTFYPADISLVKVSLDGTPYILSIVRDITDEKAQKQALLEKNIHLQQAIQEKQRLLSILAHDLRAPFSTLLNTVDILSKDWSLMAEDERQTSIRQMRSNASALYQLLENLLEWSSIRRGKFIFRPEAVSILYAVNSVIDFHTEQLRKKEIQLQISIPEDMHLQADLHAFSSILRNLLHNAIKFTPKGGQVSIAVEKTEAGGTRIHIQDSGIGMDEAFIRNLFNPLSQIRRLGTEGEPTTGLGLLLCKEMADLHGWDLQVSSQTGLGSCFTIFVPSQQDEAEDPRF